MSYTTSDLGMKLANPATRQKFETVVVNANFETLETALLVERGRITQQQSALAGINSFETRAGNTTARNAFWGVPDTLAKRVDLHNKGAKWHRNEAGTNWIEQYFAAAADVGATGARLAAGGAAGWYPIAGNMPHVSLKRGPGVIAYGVGYSMLTQAGFWIADRARSPLFGDPLTDPRPGVITFPLQGRYLVEAHVEHNTGGSILAVKLNDISSNINGVVASDSGPTVASRNHRTAVGEVAVQAGNFVSLFLYVDAVGNVHSEAHASYFRARYLGPTLI